MDNTTAGSTARYIGLVAADPSASTEIPDNNMQYSGKMYYAYNNRPRNALTGQVSAQYLSSNKQFTMSIAADKTDPYYANSIWELKPQHNQVHIDYEGKINGKLFIKDSIEGEFKGRLYGPDREVLLGTSKSLEQSSEKSWKGVVGATGTAVQ